MEQVLSFLLIDDVEAVGVVKVQARRVDASRLDSTRALSEKSDVDNFVKNVFQAFHSDVSCHVEL